MTVRLAILSGRKTGSSWQTNQFPLTVGRDTAADLVIEEEGVWDQHLQIDLQPANSFGLRARPEAAVSVNDQPAQEVPLRNGDIIGLGSVKLQFWLAEPRRPRSRGGDVLTWIGIAAAAIAQIGLIVLLLRS
ncbi:MAG: hypothetical protein C5B50_13070 [Verrucomicrobia bacterium]|nr:MAG: hypothetical protein C5B50_13070 [Verrucomicrobiota bacterium]